MTTGRDIECAANRVYKLRGKLVAVDFVKRAITIQLAEHHGKKKMRRLWLMPESEIISGHHHVDLADLIAGDWVHAHFLKHGGGAVLKTLNQR